MKRNVMNKRKWKRRKRKRKQKEEEEEKNSFIRKVLVIKLSDNMS